MPLTPYESKRTYQYVADQIVQLIRSGEFGLSERLPPERDLGKQLQVSRNVVREALLALEFAGYIETRHGVGTLVVATRPKPKASKTLDAEVSPSDVMAVRRSVEPDVAAAAALAASRDDVRKLKEALAGIMQDDAFPENEADDWTRLFHLRLAEATHNPVWVHVIENVWHLMRSPLMRDMRVRTKIYLNRRRRQKFRRDVVTCIARRDATGAHEAMERHIDAVTAFLFEKPVT
jgi:DNA-binding FadR family transcriptional regulator